MKPTTTVTATVTATPEPGPTVTVTRTATARAAVTGNCYSAGQFCRSSDHGSATTTASGASGAAIRRSYSSNAWRWTYA